MRITLAYNLRQSGEESQAELLTQEDVDQIHDAIARLNHEVTPIEVSGAPCDIVDQIIHSKPTLIFNVAEGISGVNREAYYPTIFKNLGIPFTGGDPSLLLLNLDKRLLEKVLSVKGVRIPPGAFIDENNLDQLENLKYPLFIKPNYEGTSKGITQSSIAHTVDDARAYAEELLDQYPEGLDVEEYIEGREISVPMLEAYPGHLLEIVEHVLPEDRNIFDYELKQDSSGVQVVSPPELTGEERQAVLSVADRVFQLMHCPDLGRVDIRLDNDGVPYFLEVNPLPRLLPDGSMAHGARAKGLEFIEIFDLIIRSAARRYNLSLAPKVHPRKVSRETRLTLRERGIHTGRFPTGEHNAITDVENVLVGHVTHIEDDLAVDGADGETTTLRTGITAIVPESGDLFNNHLVSGGFVLNGIGEMSGLIQAMEWGWLETPILLTNTMSLGSAHTGIIKHMIDQHPELGRKIDVIIPVIGETNDGFLNDVRHPTNTPEAAMQAIRNAKNGPVEQGSVGGGTGMISFDFAGGIGTASRRLPRDLGGHTLGVLVQSNFGKMRNLTVDGAVVGRRLDTLYPYEGRRGQDFGSAIVVVATDAPLLSNQLNRLSKRAALGLGRVGSFAASTSGEIVFAFSTANRTSRQAKGSSQKLNLTFVTDEFINPLYEAAVEATEEAVLNAIACSNGMTGKEGRYAPPLPTDTILEILGRGRDVGNGRETA